MGEEEVGSDSLDQPLFGIVDHCDDHRENLVAFLVEFSRIICGHISAVDSELEPNLCFGGLGFGITELCNECSFISSLTPCFCKIAQTDRDDLRI